MKGKLVILTITYLYTSKVSIKMYIGFSYHKKYRVPWNKPSCFPSSPPSSSTPRYTSSLPGKRPLYWTVPLLILPPRCENFTKSPSFRSKALFGANGRLGKMCKCGLLKKTSVEINKEH